MIKIRNMNKGKCYKGWIYLYINQINGKRYVGQTIDLRKRCNEHKRCKDPECLIDKAIKKYGIENFKIVILEVFTCNSIKLRRKRLDDREIYGIKHLKTYIGDYPEIGYNRTKCGKGADGFRLPNAKLHRADYSSYEEGQKARSIIEKPARDLYRKLNREIIRQKNNIYAAKHRAEKRAYDKEYYLNVRKIRESTPEYKERQKISAKKYRDSHKEERIAKMKEGRANNKDKMAAQNKLYRQTHGKDENGHGHKKD